MGGGASDVSGPELTADLGLGGTARNPYHGIQKDPDGIPVCAGIAFSTRYFIDPEQRTAGDQTAVHRSLLAGESAR